MARFRLPDWLAVSSTGVEPGRITRSQSSAPSGARAWRIILAHQFGSGPDPRNSNCAFESPIGLPSGSTPVISTGPCSKGTARADIPAAANRLRVAILLTATLGSVAPNQNTTPTLPVSVSTEWPTLSVTTRSLIASRCICSSGVTTMPTSDSVQSSACS
jgi:hypothetical protein